MNHFPKSKTGQKSAKEILGGNAYKEDPLSQRVEKHVKQLKFIEQQRENEEIGRRGVRPGTAFAQ